jgi:triosephosphate isomerase
MKKNIIIANWKMNLTASEALKLAEELVGAAGSWAGKETEVVLCPGFESLSNLKEALKDKIALGAQDCFWEDTGAYTGEVSPKVLKELGCSYVIIGHSERRQHLAETDEQINQKVSAALRNDLIPIICVGETFEERQQGEKDFVIMRQLAKALAGVEILSEDRLIVAYEPVWVIGSGQAVKPDEAEHASRVIGQILLDNLGPVITEEKTRIVYGGSVNSENVSGFLNEQTIDGILVGGASLKAESFAELIKKFN